MGLPEPIQGDLGARPVDAAQPTWDTFDYALLDLARVTDKTGGVGRPLLAQSGQKIDGSSLRQQLTQSEHDVSVQRCKRLSRR